MIGIKQVGHVWLFGAAMCVLLPSVVTRAQQGGQPSVPAQQGTKTEIGPKVIYVVAPEFSEEARKQRIQGKCTVSLTVDEKGLPQNVVVVHSIAEDVPPKKRDAAATLDEKAVEAVRQYRFRPATIDGKPVAKEIDMDVNFQLF